MKIGLNARSAKVGKNVFRLYQNILCYAGVCGMGYIIRFYTRYNSPLGDNYLPNFGAVRQIRLKLY